MLRQAIRFLIVSGVAASLYAASAIGLLLLLHLRDAEPTNPIKLAVNAVAIMVAIVTAYVGQRRWVFASTTPMARGILRLLVVTVIGAALNEAVFYLLLQFTVLSYQWSLAIALTTAMLAAFLLCKRWAM